MRGAGAGGKTDVMTHLPGTPPEAVSPERATRRYGSACFAEGAELPKGCRWDPLGNRPLSYNCDKDGWVEIEQVRGHDTDCMAEGTRMPDGWRAVPD